MKKLLIIPKRDNIEESLRLSKEYNANFEYNDFFLPFVLDDEEKKSYFELRIVYNELTEDLMLEITDWAEPDEKEDIIDLWESDIDKLKRVSGL